MGDVLLVDNDLAVTADGDLLTGDSQSQHVYHIILNSRGAYKQNPLVGVGEPKIINAPLDGQLRREVQVQLEADGFSLKEFSITDGAIDVQFDTK